MSTTIQPAAQTNELKATLAQQMLSLLSPATREAVEAEIAKPATSWGQIPKFVPSPVKRETMEDVIRAEIKARPRPRKFKRH